jgi:GNAT superfamily N-acetyltransferase
MDIQIRPATLADLDILKVYEQAMVTTELPMDSTLKQDEKIYYYDLNELIESEKCLLLVAEDDGKVIGTGYAKILLEEKRNQYDFDEYGYLGFMYLLPEYRGQGINQRIVKELIQWVKAQGLKEIRLKVYSKNPKAIRAYEKAGFVPHIMTMRVEEE